MAQRRSSIPSRIILTLALVGAMVVSLKPVIENVLNDRDTAQVAREYLHATSGDGTAPSEPDTALLEEATAYNSTLSDSLLVDPWGEDPEHGGAEYSAYLSLLGGEDPMATLSIPKINSLLPVVHGTDEAALFKGVGHFYGSDLPVGGEGTHSVLAGHHTWPGHTYFTNLEKLVVGDEFFIDVAGETLRYKVVNTSLVLPDDLAQIQPEDGKDLVTLVTCYTPPGGVLNQFRILVRGERAPDIADDAGATTTTSSTISANISDIQIQEWMYPRIVIAGVALLLLMFFIVQWIREDRAWRRRPTTKDES